MEDKIKTINAALVNAMNDMKQNDSSKTRSIFVQELLNAKLIIPSVIEPEPVDGKIAKDSVISFFSVKTKDNESVMFLFTSIEELKKWEPAKGKHLILQNYRQFKDFVTGKNAAYDGLVIDPYGANVTIKKGLIDKIDASLKPMKVSNEKISVEQDGLQPAELAPPGLYAALSEMMSRNSTINAAWMMQAKRIGENKPTVVVVVDIKGGDMKNTFNSVARTANEFLEPNESIGIMPAHDRVAARFIKGVEPFYVKGEAVSAAEPDED